MIRFPMIGKPLSVIALVVLTAATSIAGEDAAKPKIYKPDADAAAEIRTAVVSAMKNNKHVLLQIGGNWCSWCIKLEKLYKSDAEIGAFLSENYEFLHVNYSKENKNLPVLAELGYPQRFGFPVLVVLDSAGNRLHTQDSAYLEGGELGHDPKKVMSFLKQWSPAALAPENYK